jgi:hypothetical protein
METKQYTPGQQVGHVRQNWIEIWGPDDAEGSHEILGSAIGENREANAQLWAAAPELLEARQCEHNDTMDGDLLCIVAEYLRGRADQIDAATLGPDKPAHADMLRAWADRLTHKQQLQRAAIAKATGAE